MLSGYDIDITKLNNYNLNANILNQENVLCNEENKKDKEKQKKKTEDSIKEIKDEYDSLIENDEKLENILFNLTINNYSVNKIHTDISCQVYQDLGIYDDILNKINYNYTKCGKIYLIHQLFKPTDNIKLTHT